MRRDTSILDNDAKKMAQLYMELPVNNQQHVGTLNL